jgi:hypothetical protein
MNLIDRYVGAVRLFLPSDQRDDIARELGEDLKSQVEDKQEQLGRPLSAEEQAALLRQYGHPILMAARYRRARNLIGPVIFPIYGLVLKVVLGIITATHLASIGFLVVRGSWSEAWPAVTRYFDSVLGTFVFITCAAAFVEWSLSRFKVLEQWDPRSLGPVDGPLRASERAVRRAGLHVAQTESLVRRALDEAGPPVQVRSIAEFVALAVMACWGVLSLAFPSLIFATAASMLDWAPFVSRMFPIVVIVVTLALADQYLRLTKPEAGLLRFTRIVWANVGWLLLILLPLTGFRWVVWVGTPEQWARVGALAMFAGRTWSLVDVVNAVITATFVVVAIASLIGPCWRLRRWFSRDRPHTANA